MHFLVGEFDDWLDGHHLTRFDRTRDAHYIVRCKSDEVAGESVPLFANACFIEHCFAHSIGFFVCVAGREQRDDGFLALEIDRRTTWLARE